MDNHGKQDFDPTWVAPNASPENKKFIQSARLIMLKMKDGEGIKRAITDGNSLAQGAGVFVAMTINLVESKMGEKPPEDEMVIAAHLAGTIVDYAAKEGDPEAKDKKKAVMQIIEVAMPILQPDDEQAEPMPDNEQAEAMGGPSGQPPQPPMPPQGPPMPQQPQPLMGGGLG